MPTVLAWLDLVRLVLTLLLLILFYLEAVARLQGMKTIIESEYSWITPSYLKSAQYLPIKNIDFTSVRGLK